MSMKHLKSKLPTIKSILSGALFTLVSVVGYSSSVLAGSTSASQILSGANESGQGGADAVTVDGSIETITNVLLFLVGVVSVIMLIIGGFRYTTSNGDSGQIKSAKDTILYAIVGLLVAIMAYAIVRWVVGLF